MKPNCLIIPLYNEANYLLSHIAGLTLLERLYHAARRYGISQFVVLGSQNWDFPFLKSLNIIWAKQASKLIVPEGSVCVLLRPGIWIDQNFFEAIEKIESHVMQYANKNHDFIIYSGNQMKHWVQTLFSHPNFDSLTTALLSNVMTGIWEVPVNGLACVRSMEAIQILEKQLFQGLIKDTEGFMSRYVERNISLAISKRLVHTSITPNQMTIISTLVGLLGAVLISLSQGLCQILGAFLFLAHSILDGCDGEIARIKFLESRYGGLLDFWSDNIVHIAIFGAIGWEWSSRNSSGYPLGWSILAILGTLASAGFVYWNTMRNKKESGPLYTSVSRAETKSQMVRIADFLSRRDFIYLVLLLSFFKELSVFLILSAIGAPIFFLVLLGIQIQEKYKKGRNL